MGDKVKSSSLRRKSKCFIGGFPLCKESIGSIPFVIKVMWKCYSPSENNPLTDDFAFPPQIRGVSLPPNFVNPTVLNLYKDVEADYTVQNLKLPALKKEWGFGPVTDRSAQTRQTFNCLLWSEKPLTKM